jgi:TDG/mug DNA glycosylase family protein
VTDEILPDVLATRPLVVFCGTAVAVASEAANAYYAGAGNRFWSILASTRLTPSQLEPRDFMRLKSLRIGLTDLVKRRSGNDADLKASDYEVVRFKNCVEKHAPAIVAFNGKEAAKRVFRRKRVEFGIQPERIGASEVWVLPSTSNSANGDWDERHWFELAKRVAELR